MHASIFAGGMTIITLNLPAGEVLSNFQGEHRYEFWALDTKLGVEGKVNLMQPEPGTVNQFKIDPKSQIAYGVYKDSNKINAHMANRFYGKAKWNWTIDGNGGETIVGS
ncbi:hypothetical protein [Candidatus Chromulinivorax destructor]|uniref:Uncharacterized protein n=1 Tax=Candidatus Chromulinivorax destructor TaxID=2066483 RepID=A0A345ZBQ7_9BACT|nr:hypothetical protein [Candidatus Chromulinivorax destructor]AXK60724.1 hypothetical protein C0J27_03130 [Candidatus Chromulinivorax destructor]